MENARDIGPPVPPSSLRYYVRIRCQTSNHGAFASQITLLLALWDTLRGTRVNWVFNRCNPGDGFGAYTQ